MIEFQSVGKIYETGVTVQALTDISFRIDDGEFVFIIGDSGAGKSTLFKLLMAEEKPSSGRVMVDGTDVGRLRAGKKARYRRRFGVIFQDFRLIRDMTVEENVAFAMRVVNTSRRTMGRRVPRVLERMGLLEKSRQLPEYLSGGEQQRVAIARAIVNGPLYILADEPTGNLDPGNTAEVIRQLLAINASGTTVLVITHDRDLVSRLGKRVIFIQEGRVVSDTGRISQKPATPPVLERRTAAAVPEDEPREGEQHEAP